MATKLLAKVWNSMKSTLLVEDSKFVRLASERALTRAGYNVVSTDDGEQALRVAQERVPDLILLDMLLPKLGGPEVLRALKRDPITAQIPVVAEQSLAEERGEAEKGRCQCLFREIKIAFGYRFSRAS